MLLVVGATGLVGSEVCKRLRKRGEPVRALVRATSSRNKIEALRLCGTELCFGDLKDADSIAAACRGVDGIISTATSTLSRQPGDSIESVDAAGQMNLLSAAKDANVNRFLYVSFSTTAAISGPLASAKEQVENSIRGLNFTVIQASYFMEVWLSPVLGFDYANAEARIYGPGTRPISWVSIRDVAEICAIALRHPAAERRTIEFGGPEALTPLEVVRRFEKIGGTSFRLEHISEQILLERFEGATDSLRKSFAALMLGHLHGDAVSMASVVDTFGIRLTSVDEYAHGVLGKATA